MVIAPNATFTAAEIAQASGRTLGDIESRIVRRTKAGLLGDLRAYGHRGRPLRLFDYEDVKCILRKTKDIPFELDREDYAPDPVRIQALRHQLVTDGFTIRA